MAKVNRYLCVAGIVLLLAMASVAPRAQEMETVIESDGKVITIDEKSIWNMENMDENMVYVIVPGEGAALAHVWIKDGTGEAAAGSVRHFYAKTIRYTPSNESFLLEGNARMESGSDRMEGPVRIQFDSTKDMMALEGSDAAPAKFDYTDGKLKMNARARLFHFHFKVIDGKRKLNRIEKVK